MTLPAFRYHADPLASGSVVPWDGECRCCGEARGFRYDGPVYTAEDVPEGLCPWCIADGSAAEEYDATFVDSEAFPLDTPEAAVEEITTRTPGFDTWQSEEWPLCCGDATVFIMPAGLKELRERNKELEGLAITHIVHNMQISGGAATRLLNSLDRDKGPTAYLFECPTCLASRFHIDGP